MHDAKAIAVSPVVEISSQDILHAAGFEDQLNHSPWPKAALDLVNSLLPKQFPPKRPPPSPQRTITNPALKLGISL